jgi:uracil-DNA glycosylase family 4
MRTALLAITDELKRLKTSGVREVTISEETLVALRTAVRGSAAAAASSIVQTSAALSAPHAQTSFKKPLPVATASVSAVPMPPKSGANVKNEKGAAAPATHFPPPPVVVLPAGDKQMRWNALKEQVMNDPVCRAHVNPGKKIVLGVGSLDAKIFFCGEAPGADEEEQGEPFVGPAGQLLTRMIQGMGLARGDVYIGNIMNWRPEIPVSAGEIQVGNRPPTAEELAYCLPYLKAQLEVVNPDLIVALGSTATQGLLGKESFKTLGEIRSQWKLFAGKPVMVTYHPSYILRNPTNRSKRAIWEDLLKVMERAALPISEKQRSFFLDK